MSRAIVFLIIFLAACGLTRPLVDENFSITKNEALLKKKSDYLEQKAEKRAGAPDIIWIMVDDLGMADSDLYGSGTVPMPHLNKLADAGVRFSNAYVTASVCSPSRSSMLTGRYNQRFGFENQLHNRYLKNKLQYFGFKYLINSKPWVPQNQDAVPGPEFIQAMGLPDSEITIAEVLKKHGYKTGLFGKWHLTKTNENGPNAFGFDEFYGFLNANSLFASEDNPNIVSTHNKKDWTDQFIWEDGRNGLSAIQRNGEIIEEERYLTSAITSEAIDFIEKSKQPYFALLSYNAPHTPFQATAEAYAKFSDIEDPVKRTYAAMISSLDEEIGRLLTYLEETDRFKNTLIFFISDNGGAAYTHATDNGEYKGGKITDFEGGVKVPMVMTWPAEIEGGKLFTSAVSSMDIYQTILQTAVTDVPPITLDGVDLLPAVQADEPIHEYLFFRKGYNHSIRSENYKLSWSTKTSDTLMFDIRKDPYEKVNIYGEANAQMAELLRAYAQWELEMVEASWPGMINYQWEDEDKNVYWFEN